MKPKPFLGCVQLRAASQAFRLCCNFLFWSNSLLDFSPKYHLGILQSMTCDLRLQLAEVRCAVASCDVHAEPTLVVTWDVSACSAF